jgi:hypothetical protein
MKLYIFKSEANGGLYAFAGDEAGSNLPAGFARPGIRKDAVQFFSDQNRKCDQNVWLSIVAH